MKVKVTQQIESETPGKPHMPGTVIEHRDAWRLCEIFNDGKPVAEPLDEEAKEAVKPGIARRERTKATIEKQAADFAKQEHEQRMVAEALKTSEFEKTLLEGT